MWLKALTCSPRGNIVDLTSRSLAVWSWNLREVGSCWARGAEWGSRLWEMRTFPGEMHNGSDSNQTKDPEGSSRGGEAPVLQPEGELRFCNVSAARRACSCKEERKRPQKPRWPGAQGVSGTETCLRDLHMLLAWWKWVRSQGLRSE